jgi:hypothetical protein
VANSSNRSGIRRTIPHSIRREVLRAFALALGIQAPAVFAQEPPSSLEAIDPPDSAAIAESRDVMDVVHDILHGPRVKTRLEGETETGFRWVIIPSLSYNPVYEFAIGASATGAGRLGGDPAGRISTLSLSGNYSTTQQVQVQVRGDMFFASDDMLLRLDTRYLDTTRPSFVLGPVQNDLSEYPMKYKLVRGYGTLCRRVQGPVYAGVGMHLDSFADILDERAEDGELTPYAEYAGGTPTDAHSIGFSFNLLGDSRDNPVNPRSGYLISTFFRANLTELGSDTNWQEMWAEYRVYPHLPGKSRNRLAFWLYTWFTFGQPPFLNLPHVGGDTYARSGRGYLIGRIRSQNLVYLESEYRVELRRDGLLGAVFFVNGTSAALPESGVFGRLDSGGGAGLRLKLNKKSDTNFAVDLGWGDGDSFGVFFGTTEVF